MHVLGSRRVGHELMELGVAHPLPIIGNGRKPPPSEHTAEYQPGAALSHGNDPTHEVSHSALERRPRNLTAVGELAAIVDTCMNFPHIPGTTARVNETA